MTKRPISDELLSLTIETRLDAGVSAERIRVLVEAFAGDEPEAGADEETIGFLWVEDIAHSRRGAFLNAVLALTPEPKLAVSHARRAGPRGGMSAMSLLTRAKTALRFASA